MNTRYCAIFLLSLLTGCAAGPGRQHASHLTIKRVAPSQYSFENATYSYSDLIGEIRREYSEVGYIDADMGSASTVGDLLEACALQKQTGIPVHAHYEHDGKTSGVTCQ